MCSTYMVYIHIYRYITLFEKLLFVTVTAHLPLPTETHHRHQPVIGQLQTRAVRIH